MSLAVETLQEKLARLGAKAKAKVGGAKAQALEAQETALNANTGAIIPQRAADNQDREPIKENSILTGRLKSHCEAVHNYTKASMQQVEIMALGLYGFALSYAGVQGTALYVFDLSDTGTGKSQNERMQREAICEPIMRIQSEKHKTAYDFWESTPRKERPQSPEKHINIHAGKVTAPLLYQSFINQPAQLVVVDEIGLMMERADGQELIDYITKAYGATTVSLPSLKSEASREATTDGRLSFIGMSTISYFRQFKRHLEGGFANRPIICYETELRAPGMLPESYTLPREVRDDIARFTEKMIRLFDGGVHNFQIDSHIFRDFQKEAQQKLIDLKAIGSPSANMYVRASQNVETIARVLHGLRCTEQGTIQHTVSDDCILEAIRYYEARVEPSIEALSNELSGAAREERDERLLERVQARIGALGLPCNMRDVYKPLKITKTELMKVIEGTYRTHRTKIVK